MIAPMARTKGGHCDRDNLNTTAASPSTCWPTTPGFQDLAARLQGLAEPNGIAIDATTRRQICGLFECQDLGKVALKRSTRSGALSLAGAARGRRREPLRGNAWPVRTRPPHDRARRGVRAATAPWRQAQEGEGQPVLLSGEPGIGSRGSSQPSDQRLHCDDTITCVISVHHTIRTARSIRSSRVGSRT